MTCFLPGTAVHGKVTSVTERGAWMNIGAVIDGFPVLPPELVAEFQVGHEVKGMDIVEIDVTTETVMLAMPKPAPAQPAAAAASKGPRQEAKKKWVPKEQKQEDEDQ